MTDVDVFHRVPHDARGQVTFTLPIEQVAGLGRALRMAAGILTVVEDYGEGIVATIGRRRQVEAWEASADTMATALEVHRAAVAEQRANAAAEARRAERDRRRTEKAAAS